MSPQFPVEDPSRYGSLVERTSLYVRRNAVLRWVLIATLFDHLAAIAMVFSNVISATMAGLLGLLSVFAWFFAVMLPMMNREVRRSAGADPQSYWSELVEMFGRVVLFVQTALYTALLVIAVF